MDRNAELIRQLRERRTLEPASMKALLTSLDADDERQLYAAARQVREAHYGKEVYLRGLVEFTSYCKNDCLYCGLRRSNAHAQRYRLSQQQILECCNTGYDLGFRTFVLQGGEDARYTDELVCRIVSRIREAHPDCAVTLSIGEKSRRSYQAFFDAGAERYLLRQETTDPWHYARLHPREQTLKNRQRCLYDLMDIGYQVGCGFMVGSPYQTWDFVLEDLYFMKDLQPHMVGIGPFIPHKDTPFRDQPRGTLEDTLHLLAVIRLMLPDVLLPATTALGTIHPLGRELGLLAGANVVMPNLSPKDVRKKYLLYDGKICTGDEAAECRHCMERRVARVGYQVVESRGDHPSRRAAVAGVANGDVAAAGAGSRTEDGQGVDGCLATTAGGRPGSPAAVPVEGATAPTEELASNEPTPLRCRGCSTNVERLESEVRKVLTQLEG